MESPHSPFQITPPSSNFSSARRRSYAFLNTEVCLEDWWLSRPSDGKGIAVSGTPTGRCEKMWMTDSLSSATKSHSAKRRYASRAFHSKEIVKRHSSTTVETSDGVIISLCGFINRSRTKGNGFSSEVCRDFIYGFPVDWENFAAESVAEESSRSNLGSFSKCFPPPSLDPYNGAQLHDLVLSFTDTEREAFSLKVYTDVMRLLNPPKELSNNLYDVKLEEAGELKHGSDSSSRTSENRCHLPETGSEGTLLSGYVLYDVEIGMKAGEVNHSFDSPGP